jgi:hypothetical protein
LENEDLNVLSKNRFAIQNSYGRKASKNENSAMNRSLLVAQSPREVVVDEEAVDLLLKYFDIDRDG